ncbi:MULTISPECIES: polysaccharide biosynthesis protein [Devosia]|uniref:polysaccharide biosynthesis protein n=1 Tax=Devosia TaxID=46913 RepID=UPI000CE94DDE|nr:MULTISPECIES: nucleoside-diphosphate sugar epimerase/dehydratase [Devosia]AVF02962.1 polysaccharide biosynthesis protein [Devosia sp. I507]
MIRELTARILSIPRRWKRVVLVTSDTFILVLAAWASLAIRLDTFGLPGTTDEWFAIISAPIVAIPIFAGLGLYRPVVRYLPERAMWTIFKATALSVMAWVLVAFMAQLLWRGSLPRSVPIIFFAIACVLLIGSRFLAKWLISHLGRDVLAQRPSVVIYGAGAAGTQLALSLKSTHDVVAFVDDDPTLHRREVANIRVHSPSALPALLDNYAVQQIILSMPSISADRRKAVVADVSRHGVKVQSLPDISDLVTGKYLVSQVREIEIDDLLGRSTVPPDLDLIRQMVSGKTIMVTGAGGSIGSELCRKISQWRPQRLVLFEANEFALYKIDRELAGSGEAAVVPVLGSVTDEALVRRTMEHYAVGAVFHAAAHKHVPLVEANALEGIENNVFGTKTVVDVAFSVGVKNFVLISTDKAVRPTNVMGATKRWAELIVREKAAEAAAANTGQQFCAVRFGNVLGSNGSVVPLFKEQIAHGGPITLTDPAMTRYFMSIKEAAELIVQAGALSKGGDVFLLDMGEPMLISELAENMVRLAGLSVRNVDNPHGDIEIVAVGKRPGEKLYEELFYDDAAAERTRHPKILRAAAASDDLHMQQKLNVLRSALHEADESLARSLLFGLVVETDVNVAGRQDKATVG